LSAAHLRACHTTPGLVVVAQPLHFSGDGPSASRRTAMGCGDRSRCRGGVVRYALLRCFWTVSGGWCVVWYVCVVYVLQTHRYISHALSSILFYGAILRHPPDPRHEPRGRPPDRRASSCTPPPPRTRPRATDVPWGQTAVTMLDATLCTRGDSSRMMRAGNAVDRGR
jgi:hypothetical protein